VQYRDGAFVDTFHNRQCEKITGYSAKEFTEQPDLWYTMIHKDDRQLVVENLESIKQTKKSFYIEHRIIHKSGDVRWISNSCIAVVNEFEKKFQCIGFILDISDKKDLEQKLYHHATTDELTGIYNRREGFKALELCISKSLRLNMISTICYFDINNLKEVNDCLGHSLGDDMLKTMVTLVQHELRSSDIFTRIGGDEFVLIFANTSLAGAQNILHRIVKAIVEFNTKRSRAYRLYVSYGFSELAPQSGRMQITPEQLIETADKEMYFYKERSKMHFKTAIAGES
jgi:diguanylate cyclase